MAVKDYGYYIKGNKIGLVERDTRFENDVSSKDYGPGTNRVQWKSPLSTVADGLEIQYAYSPEYFLNSSVNAKGTIQYKVDGGYLVIADNESPYINWTSTYTVTTNSYIVLRNAGKYNGLHKVQEVSSATGTNNVLKLWTKVPGGSTSYVSFEEQITIYTNVAALEDESSIIQVPPYLAKALVYYVKARVQEDGMDIEGKEYNMKQFRSMVEKHNNTRVSGLRIISPGAHAIK